MGGVMVDALEDVKERMKEAGSQRFVRWFVWKALLRMGKLDSKKLFLVCYVDWCGFI
jgi:hypothetical protein